jgi:hypothetical protein
MKAKKFSKKLTINKATIANLSKDKQEDVRGGINPTNYYTCPYTLCPYTDCGDSIVVVCYC